MHYIIKRVPRIPSVNRFGIPYTGNKTWDYKNTKYYREDGTWKRSKTNAKVFEGTPAEAGGIAMQLKITHTDPNDREFVGYVEVELNSDGTIRTNEGY